MLKLTAKELRVRALDGAVNGAVGIGTFALLSQISDEDRRRLAAKAAVAAGSLGVFATTFSKKGIRGGEKGFVDQAVLNASGGIIIGGVLTLLYKKL